MGDFPTLSRRTALFSLLCALAAAASLGACKRSAHSRDVPGGDVERGRSAIKKYACGTCHIIPGVEGAVGQTSHPLHGFSNRGDIAGVAPNTPQNLIKWVQKPTDLLPRTKMPALGVTDQDARDIAAYLYTLRGE